MTGESSPQHSTRSKVALAVTGGIAAYKAIEVLRGFQRAGCEVRVAMTRHACEFIQPLTFRALSGSYVIVDDYAVDNPDPIAHITFSQSVDLFVVAPATANVIAKFAHGVADDFVTSTYLACRAPVLIAPAMNTTMWHHPATQRNVEKLRQDGVQIIQPDEGEMACRTIGPGRLSEPEIIVNRGLEILNQLKNSIRRSVKADSATNDLHNEKILITAGATREPIDPVRFISNRSSGRMGFALAEAAASRGAQVTVIAGVTTVTPRAAVSVVRVNSAAEMHEAVARAINDATIFIGAAAISDYRPEVVSATKIKKTRAHLELKLERTDDILAQVSRGRRNGQLIIGFAAETDNVIENAREKLKAKSLDAIIANDVSQSEIGFESENNAGVILVRDNSELVELPLMSKLNAAHRILDEVVKLRRSESAETAIQGN